ncbi:hypothetical protein BKA56DRAFT_663148 [Ilyonectria sp. MPI-CAGE-AT-0026]|nr:hypothetical protein BKA56DRAFT_663148 [Ilyonectria sp. MPI-CAGE-AT-0026]
MTFEEPQKPPSFASPIPPFRPGWARPDQQFPSPTPTHPGTPTHQTQQPHLDAQQQHLDAQQQYTQQQRAQQQQAQQQQAQQQQAQQQQAKQQHLDAQQQHAQQQHLDAQQQHAQQQQAQQQQAQQQHAQRQHAQQQQQQQAQQQHLDAQQQHAQQQHAQWPHLQWQHAQQPHAPSTKTFPPHWPGYAGPGLKGSPLNPFVSGVQQGMQAFMKENGKQLSKAVGATVMDEIRGPFLGSFNRELESLRTLLEEALSQWQPSINSALLSLQSQLVDLQFTMNEFVPMTGAAYAELREELASMQRSFEASKPRRPLPSSPRTVKQAKAIKEMMRQTQGSVEVLRGSLGSRKGSQTRRVGRISASKKKKGKAKTRQKSRSGSRANRGPAQRQARAIGQGVGQGICQNALLCTAPRASKDPSLPAGVAGDELGRSIKGSPYKRYRCDGCTSTEKQPTSTQPHGLRRSLRIHGKQNGDCCDGRSAQLPL